VPSDVKPRRAYNSENRLKRAAANRAAVLDAAARAFLEDGYAAVSIPTIAKLAEVSPEFIYKAFGAKPELLKAMFDRSVAGDDEPIAIQQRPDVRRLAELTDAADVIDGYADFLATVQVRVAPVYLLARDAAAADPAAAPVFEQMNAERLAGMGAMARQLVRLKQLRKGLKPDEVRDVLWTYNSPEIYDLLVLRRNWSIRRYSAFIRQALRAALLDG
jgi:AcrR family transcriptional regulator